MSGHCRILGELKMSRSFLPPPRIPLSYQSSHQRPSSPLPRARQPEICIPFLSITINLDPARVSRLPLYQQIPSIKNAGIDRPLLPSTLINRYPAATPDRRCLPALEKGSSVLLRSIRIMPPAADSPAILVARFLRTNAYPEVRQIESTFWHIWWY